MILLDLQKDGPLKHHLNLPLVGLIHVDSVGEVLWVLNQIWTGALPRRAPAALAA